MKTFAERFKELRAKKHYTQEELAKDFNNKYHYSFNKSSISLYENGNRIPEINALKDWASYFGVSTSYLLGETDAIDSELIKEDSPLYQVKKLEEEFPDGVRVLCRGNKKLTDSQKKIMVNIINDFIDSHNPENK